MKIKKQSYIDAEEEAAYEMYTKGVISLDEYCELLHLYARMRGDTE